MHEGLGRSRRRSKGFFTKMRAEWDLRDEIDGKGVGRIDDTAGEDGAMRKAVGGFKNPPRASYTKH